MDEATASQASRDHHATFCHRKISHAHMPDIGMGIQKAGVQSRRRAPLDLSRRRKRQKEEAKWIWWGCLQLTQTLGLSEIPRERLAGTSGTVRGNADF